MAAIVSQNQMRIKDCLLNIGADKGFTAPESSKEVVSIASPLNDAYLHPRVNITLNLV
jgi:hypothetical protein